MNSETDLSIDSYFNEFANEIRFVGYITSSYFKLNLFLQLLKYKLKGPNWCIVFDRLTRWHSWSKAERWLNLLNSENASIFKSLIKYMILIVMKNILCIY